MTTGALIIHCYKTVVFLGNYSILPSSCCSCTNIYYVMTLIGSCSCLLCLNSLKFTCESPCANCIINT